MPVTYVSDHLHLRSTDPEAAARFYVEALGARETDRGVFGGALRVVVELSGFRLFIEAVPGGTAAPPPAPFLGLEHIGLEVSDLDAAASDLRARGTTFLLEPMSPRPGVKMAFIAAPDGVRVELIERK